MKNRTSHVYSRLALFLGLSVSVAGEQPPTTPAFAAPDECAGAPETPRRTILGLGFALGGLPRRF